ncbi:lysozyme inhibitor LprI family protein [Ruegeria sp. MALMAid1280]|uniref:lysozyme inhibitor LprI family protein n=1 Tax=Ruegeria sp. MALMAid1280 TaxID=3411634 RepID=UPI003BA024F8
MRTLVLSTVFSFFGVFSVAAFAQPLQTIDDFVSETHLNMAECFNWELSDQLTCYEQAIRRCRQFTQNLSTAGGAYHCNDVAFREIDAKLNEVYPVYLAAAPNNVYGTERADESEELLRTAQRAWVKYRDAMCEIEARWNAIHSGFGAVVDDCRSRLTLMQMHTLQSELGGFIYEQ